MNTRFLGIDWGKRKIGIAITNSGGNIAFPLVCFENNDNIYHNIAEIIKNENISKIFIGMPLDINGNLPKIAPEIHNFGSNINKITQIEICYIDERMSTKFAHTNQLYAGEFGKQSFRAAKSCSSNKFSIRNKNGKKTKINLNKLDFNDDMSAACNILSLAICSK